MPTIKGIPLLPCDGCGTAGSSGPTGSTGPTGPTGPTGSTGPINALVQAATAEPTGHENRLNSTISLVVDDVSGTFTIAGTHVVWVGGNRYPKVAATETVNFAAGPNHLYYIYYDLSGNLGVQNSYFVWDQQAPTAYVYYNASYGAEAMLFDERHGITMDWATHEYLHRTRGAAIANGLGIYGYTTTGTGDLASDSQFSLNTGTFFDEDLQVDISDGAPGIWSMKLSTPATMPTVYRQGPDTWRKTDVSENPYYPDGGSPNSFMYYNSLSAGNWSLVPTSNGKFTVQWIVATNMAYTPVLSIMNQSDYPSLIAAQAVEFSDLDLTSLPIVEFRPLYKVIFQNNSNYASPNNTRIVYVEDIRQLSAISGTGIPAQIGPTGPTGPGFTTITNAGANRVLISDGTTNAASAATGLTWVAGTSQLTVSGDATVTGKLTVNGVIDPTGLIFDPVPSDPSAGSATLWVNSTNNRLTFGYDGMDLSGTAITSGVLFKPVATDPSANGASLWVNSTNNRLTYSRDGLDISGTLYTTLTATNTESRMVGYNPVTRALQYSNMRDPSGYILFVAKTGDANGNGTFHYPYRDISSALLFANAASTVTYPDIVIYVAPGQYNEGNLTISRRNITITGMTDDAQASANKVVEVRGSITTNMSINSNGPAVTGQTIRLSNMTISDAPSTQSVLTVLGNGYSVLLTNIQLSQTGGAPAVAQIQYSQDQSGSDYSSRVYMNRVFINNTSTGHGIDISAGQIWQLEDGSITTTTGKAVQVTSNAGHILSANNTQFTSTGIVMDISSNNRASLGGSGVAIFNECLFTSNDCSSGQILLGRDISGSFTFTRCGFINNGTAPTDASENFIRLRPSTTAISILNNFAVPGSLGTAMTPYGADGDATPTRSLLYFNNTYLTLGGLLTSPTNTGTYVAPSAGYVFKKKLTTEP